jgi:hypothetical protein
MREYYIGCRRFMNCRTIECISKDRKKVQDWIDKRTDGVYEVDTRSLNFEIDGLEQIYTITNDIDRMDIFVDVGDYYKTYEEAKADLSKKEKYSSTRVMIEHIAVL